MSCFILTLTIFLLLHSPATVAGATNTSNTVTYHGGPLLTGDITVTIIWYGSWKNSHKTIIKEFINSITSSEHRSHSVYSWWKTVKLYTDYTGANISGSVKVGKEMSDSYSHGYDLAPQTIKIMVEYAAVFAKYAVSVTLPTNRLLGTCKGYPTSGWGTPQSFVLIFARTLLGFLIISKVSVADVCLGIYGRGGGPSYPGDVLSDRHGASYNIRGIKKKFLVQWMWNPVLNDCTGSD
ncbi:protein EXORDIUM-like 3 [Bidens hawaiensis]|uniref:protein EXORDIUM-like 3 n=1 Tax=Bidens hawaiensis TaxID=980011 RepID=UPI00404A56DA